jgi:hypothetical protein
VPVGEHYVRVKVLGILLDYWLLAQGLLPFLSRGFDSSREVQNQRFNGDSIGDGPGAKLSSDKAPKRSLQARQFLFDMFLQSASAVRPCLVLSWNLGKVTGVVSKTNGTGSGVEQPRNNFRQEGGKRSLSLRFISVMKSLVVVAAPLPFFK